MKRLMILAALFAASVAQAQVYKCQEGGKTVFSDMPCASGRAINVRPATGPSLSPADRAAPVAPEKSVVSKEKALLDQYERERKLRAIDYDIEQIERTLENDQKRLDADLKAYQRKKMYANNNLAGATWESSISQEMQAMAQRYEMKAASDRAKLEKLRAERESLMK
ncbi:DUF4124 domain-containing protein [Aromatoleum toluclasticum]|uniref:DUF4124 domain-containing protein n=1 Tax=Aromatoleum toluclasticum TaxID=92003 RepID=UPI001D18A20C|nr:DUF4124 domain-containing protein [Aromatoleum toluclasticum]MCC4116371.1 DUF4124 domain-containing protein [Aromatoleum toluclasticum]